MSPPEKEISEFHALLGKFPMIWDGLEIRVMAFRIEGVWHNALTRCRLFTDSGQPTKPMYLPASENVRTFHAIWPVDAFSDLIESVGRGEITIDDTPIRYTRNDSYHNTPQPYTFYWYEGIETRESQLGRDWVPTSSHGWSGINFRGTGDLFSELLRSVPRHERDLDEEVHSMHTPLDGINGIAEHVIGLKADWRTERRSQFTLTAPLEARFISSVCRLHSGMLDLGIEAGSLLVRSHLDVGYVASNDRGILVSESIDIHSTKWDTTNPSVARIRIEAPDATAATALLRIGQRRIERLSLTDLSRLGQNPRHAAYSLIDPDLTFLNTALKGTSKEGKDFERAVARLLALLGYQVIALGPEGKLSDAIDVVAFDPFSSSVFAVECTTGSLDPGGKLGKLVMRTSDLTGELPNHTVQAVIITSKPNKSLSDAQRQHAARDRISVLAAEELEELLVRVGMAASLSEITSYVRSKVPALPSVGLTSMGIRSVGGY